MNGDTHSSDEQLRELEIEVARLRRTASLGDVAEALFSELRCLMAPVAMSNELLAKRLAPDKELGKLAGHAASASAFATRLLRDTLDYVHQPVSAPKPIVLAEVLTQLRAMLEGLVGHGVELVIEREEDAKTTVRADRIGLERTLLNMVCHARDRAPGVARVTLSTRATTLDDAEARRSSCPAPGRHIVACARGNAPLRSDSSRADGAHARVQKLALEHGWGFSNSQEAGRVPAICIYLPEVK